MFDILKFQIDSPQKLLFLIDNIVIMLCTAVIIIAVIIDFVEFDKKDKVKAEKKSIVETGTMFLFFLAYYSFIRFGIGYIKIEFNLPYVILNIICLAVLIAGCAFNVIGRFNLGGNWSNQIKVYKDHSFVSTGVYSIVRHPLYASLIWIFIAASLIFMNYLALFATLLIFIPFMYYRAKQEEVVLATEFKEYKIYQRRVGMFFPKMK